MLGVALSFGMPSLPWAIASWVASECVLLLVSSWVLRRATGYSISEQFGGIVNPLLASLLMAAAVIRLWSELSRRLGAGPAAELAGAAGRDDLRLRDIPS